MDCFTSPTAKRVRPPWEMAEKTQFCTWLVSWYSSTITSRYRWDTVSASSVGVPSSPRRRRTA